MQNFAMMSWADERVISYEPIVAESEAEARAFSQGMVTERARDHASMLAEQGVRYIIEHGHRSLEQLISYSAAHQIGSWIFVEVNGEPKLEWNPSARPDG